MMMLLGNNRINISGHTGGTCRTCKADQANIIPNKYDFVRTIIKQFLKFLFCQQNVSQKNLNPSQTVTVS